jgi:hypothetical protein
MLCVGEAIPHRLGDLLRGEDRVAGVVPFDGGALAAKRIEEGSF